MTGDPGSMVPLRMLRTSADVTVGSEFNSGLDEHPDALTKRILSSKAGQFIEAVAPSMPSGLRFPRSRYLLLRCGLQER